MRTLIAGAVAIAVIAAWLTVRLIGEEIPEPEFTRLVDRSEALALLPPPDQPPSEFESSGMLRFGSQCRQEVRYVGANLVAVAEEARHSGTVVRTGDNALVLGQRLSELVTRAPELEEELAEIMKDMGNPAAHRDPKRISDLARRLGEPTGCFARACRLRVTTREE